ncbi:E3 ubiquitin-protein ligase TRIM71-like [Papio anubis]|uniref:E3 ubiquitin-protein ligase TRIM71-like n=1 Tax=Papio anubis TaxID=9555 RepID=UPI0004F1FA3C|nr:E3 ubiquitin-protein ligase TRIM71-like [Papio anubis]
MVTDPRPPDGAEGGEGKPAGRCGAHSCQGGRWRGSASRPNPLPPCPRPPPPEGVLPRAAARAPAPAHTLLLLLLPARAAAADDSSRSPSKWLPGPETPPPALQRVRRLRKRPQDAFPDRNVPRLSRREPHSIANHLVTDIENSQNRARAGAVSASSDCPPALYSPGPRRPAPQMQLAGSDTESHSAETE